MRTEYIEQLAAEYKADPNCWPELWISGENVNEQERALFIQLVSK